MGFPWAKGSSFKEGIRELSSLIKDNPFIFPKARRALCNCCLGEGKKVPTFVMAPGLPALPALSGLAGEASLSVWVTECPGSIFTVHWDGLPVL